MILNESTWCAPNNILLLLQLNTLKYKKVYELTKDDRHFLCKVCGNDEFFDNLDINPQENVWGLVCMYLDGCNEVSWYSEFFKLKYYDNYGWAFEDKKQCFKSLFKDGL